MYRRFLSLLLSMSLLIFSPVRVRAQDRDGNFFEVEDEELTARCFCHEIEHLDGHLFVEHTDHLMTEEELEEYMNQQEEDEE